MALSKNTILENIRLNNSSKFARFIYTIRFLEVVCQETFQELYETTEGFVFSIDDAGAKIPVYRGKDFIQGAEFNQVYKTDKVNKPISLKYKLFIDNGSVVDLRTRSVRINFINTLIQKIKSESVFTRLALRNGFVRLDVGAGGKNPTLAIQIKYEKSFLNRKSGKREKRDISLILNLSLKAKSDKAGKDENPFKKFLPGKVQGLLGNKLSTTQFKTLLENYIESLQISKGAKQTFLKSIDLAYKDTKLKVASIGSSDFSSELFEVLSALKLARNIETKNAGFLKKTLGWNQQQIQAVNPSEVKIFMPTAANEALMDYEVYYNSNNSIKVSVKSKLSSNPATVKFNSVFADEREVSAWFNGLTNKTDSIRGSAIVAGNAMTYKKKYGGKETLYPIKALHDLLTAPTFSSSAWSDMSRNANLNTDGMNKNMMRSILLKTHRAMGSANYRYAPLDTLARYTPDELAALKMFIAKNIRYTDKGATESYIEIANKNIAPKEVVEKVRGRDKVSYTIMGVKDYPKLKGDDRYPFTLNNLAYLSEKAVVATSKKSGNSKINFWQLFYDNVLSKKQILYSVMYENKVANNLSLEYKFVSMVNFSKYSDWVELRSKNNAFNMQDTLGMNV